MAVRRIRAGGGLATDPSELEGPELLRVADNVLLHRPGTIQPRPGFGDDTGVEARTTDSRPIAIVPFDGDLVVQSYDFFLDTYRLERAGADHQYTGDATPPDESVSGVSSFAQARGSLYFTTESGVRKLAGIADSATQSAGVPTDYVAINFEQKDELVSSDAHTDRYAVAEDGSVAYRYCWVSEDSNGYVRRSAPSARWVTARDSTSGGAAVEMDRVMLPDGIGEGDRIEIYRTENATPFTATPGTEYYLALEYTVTAADEALGYIEQGTMVDDVPDAMLGATLYTSPSQGGISQSNERPPLSGTLASWAGVMWFGDTVSRKSLTIEFVSVNDSDEHNDKVGVRQITGFHVSFWLGGSSTYTLGSNVIGNVHTTGNMLHGIKVGQYITDSSDGPSVAGPCVPALTKITACSCTYTVSSPSDGDTLTLFGHEFTWKTSAAGDDQIELGATDADSATNLAAILDAFEWEDAADVIDVSAAASGADVTLTEAGGYLPVVVTFDGSGDAVQEGEYTIEMSAGATANGSVNSTVRIADFIEINGVEFYADIGTQVAISANPALNNPALRLFEPDFSSTGGSPQDYQERLAITADNLARSVNAYSLLEDPDWGVIAYRDFENSQWSGGPGDGAIVLLNRSVSGGEITAQCTIRPRAFRPEMASKITSEDTTAPNRLYWSKLQQPEAVPLLNFVDIGASTGRILALVPTRDALLVWKEDGLFSVTGSAPSSWVVDEVDTGVRLLAPQAVCVLDGVCFALTDRGVVAATAAGVQVVSGPIAAELRAYQQLLPRGADGTRRAFWMVAHQRLGLVVLGVGSGLFAAASDAQYVFHARSGGRWARWTREDWCAAYDPVEDRMVVSPGIDAWSLLYERSDESDPASYADAEVATAPSGGGGVSASWDGDTATIEQAEFGGHVPAAGDVITYRNPELGASAVSRVVAVKEGPPVDGRATYLVTVEDGTGMGSSVSWYQAIPAAVEWHPQHLPGHGSRWSEAHVVLESDASEYLETWPLDIGGQRSEGTSADMLTATIAPNGSPYQSIRVGVPRAIVRAYQMGPRIAVNAAGVLWRVAELALHFAPQGRRVRR